MSWARLSLTVETSHANPIKYSCPRCGIHTCSLPCVKRHKSWAQCSGIRDPAAYRKRSDLATPASVDQDFNFITSVERSLQAADSLFLDKGIDLAPSGVKRRGHEPKRKFDTEIEARGIRLIKAPRGLSRNKQNKSHWTGQHKCLMWTTEWLCYDGDKRIQNVIESKTVGETFVSIFGKNAIHKKRKWSSVEATTTVPAVRRASQLTQPDRIQEEIPLQDHPATERDVEQQDTGPEETIPAHENRVVDRPPLTEKKAQVVDVSEILQNLHFYLLRPSTAAKLKCLIPVPHTATLMDVLNDKTLLEFPTFYVKEEAPDNLPAPFIVEDKYNELYGDEIPIEVSTATTRADPDARGAVSLPDSIDEKTVLEVLQKDLMG